MRVREKTLLLITVLVMASLSVAAIALAIYRLHFPSVGVVPAEVEVKVFADQECRVELANGTAVDWGAIHYGPNVKTLWVKNVGNCWGALTLHVSSLPPRWSLTWDYNQTRIPPGGVHPITLTLTVPSGTPAGTYTWNFWIIAEERPPQ